jgi:hypothetical protein
MTTATATATTNLPLLRKGDNGDSVRFLEQLLSSVYWFSQKPNAPILITENVKFDGVYDEQ